MWLREVPRGQVTPGSIRSEHEILFMSCRGPKTSFSCVYFLLLHYFLRDTLRLQSVWSLSCDHRLLIDYGDDELM